MERYSAINGRFAFRAMLAISSVLAVLAAADFGGFRAPFL